MIVHIQSRSDIILGIIAQINGSCGKQEAHVVFEVSKGVYADIVSPHVIWDSLDDCQMSTACGLSAAASWACRGQIIAVYEVERGPRKNYHFERTAQVSQVSSLERDGGTPLPLLRCPFVCLKPLDEE